VDHGGLNDLSLSLGLDNPFEVVASDLLSVVAERVLAGVMRFGLAVWREWTTCSSGLSGPGFRSYARLGATSAWLSRSFFRGLVPRGIAGAVRDLRQRIAYWPSSANGLGAAARRAGGGAARTGIRGYELAADPLPSAVCRAPESIAPISTFYLACGVTMIRSLLKVDAGAVVYVLALAMFAPEFSVKFLSPLSTSSRCQR